jgi:hypothetical protein
MARCRNEGDRGLHQIELRLIEWEIKMLDRRPFYDKCDRDPRCTFKRGHPGYCGMARVLFRMVMLLVEGRKR